MFRKRKKNSSSLALVYVYLFYFILLFCHTHNLVPRALFPGFGGEKRPGDEVATHNELQAE